MIHVRALLRYFPALGLLVANVCIADIYKCVGEDGAVAYSDSPCTGAQTLQTDSAAEAGARRFTRRDADIAYECMEALNITAQQIKARESGGAADVRHTFERQFQQYCPGLGFRAPLSDQTLQFNSRHAETLKEKLKLSGHSGPSFRRTYSGGNRMPPLFSTIAPTDPERNQSADEWPNFKKGVWRLDIQAGARSRVLEQCQRPVDQLRTMMRVYADGYACQWGRVKSVAGGATAQARNCRGTGANGEAIEMTANMRVEVFGADYFVAELRMGSVKEQLNGRRISDCPDRPSPNELPS